MARFAIAMLLLAAPAAADLASLHPHGWHGHKAHGFHYPLAHKQAALVAPAVQPVPAVQIAAPVAMAAPFAAMPPPAAVSAPAVFSVAPPPQQPTQAPAAKAAAEVPVPPVAAAAVPDMPAAAVVPDMRAPVTMPVAPEAAPSRNSAVVQMNQELAEVKQHRTNIAQLQQALEADVALLRESSTMVKVAATARSRAEAEAQVRKSEQLVRDTGAMLRGSREAAVQVASAALKEASEIQGAAAALEKEAAQQLRDLAPPKAAAPQPAAPQPAAPQPVAPPAAVPAPVQPVAVAVPEPASVAQQALLKMEAHAHDAAPLKKPVEDAADLDDSDDDP